MGILDYNQKVAFTFSELAGSLATLIPDPLGPVLGPQKLWAAVQDKKVTLLFYGPGGKYLCYNHQSLKACVPKHDSTILDIRDALSLHCRNHTLLLFIRKLRVKI